MTEEQEKTLRRVNEIRRDVIKELGKFEDDLKLCKTGGEKAACLYGFLEAIELPARIEDRAKALKERGNMQLCDEYLQLWDILVNGLEQYAAVIGGRDSRQ